MRLWHRHTWELRGVNEVTLTDDGGVPVGARTELLYVCRGCDKPRVKTLAGKWSSAQLLPAARKGAP